MTFWIRVYDNNKQYYDPIKSITSVYIQKERILFKDNVKPKF